MNSSADHPQTGGQTERPSVLIVDDSEAMTRGLGRLFREAGFVAETFAAGRPAICFAKDRKPQAAIVDIHLPDLCGLVVSAELRAILGPDAPIIVLSGDDSMEMINSLPHVGASYFFRKPVLGSVLLQHLRDLLPPSS